jgi:hypothetical protein
MKYALKMGFTFASIVWFFMVTGAACVVAVEGDHSQSVLRVSWAIFAFGPMLVVGLIGSVLGWLFRSRPTTSDHMNGLRARRT